MPPDRNESSDKLTTFHSLIHTTFGPGKFACKPPGFLMVQLRNQVYRGGHADVAIGSLRAANPFRVTAETATVLSEFFAALACALRPE